ncbi:cation diffusion facilitator family transporter [Devosia sp. 1566]|uniref:cation diffusion facilitator family transporter n=1 Tax=Devosia sp. 1566 TaxID=2499144 RepID=UPI000FDCDBC5|nr:cation diffusion facilitator family transporter [Devosia sp. 1566]
MNADGHEGDANAAAGASATVVGQVHDHHEHDHASHSHEHDDHGHHHDHGGHSHAPKVGANNERVVLIGFALTAGFMLVELVAGWLSGSLALIADAGHMLTDAGALLLAWAAFRFGRRASDATHTFGFMRLEVVAGLVNALTLFALAGWILFEAVQRVMSPQPVLAGPMLVVAILGLGVNLLVFRTLQGGDKDHVNIRGAALHVLGDMLGSAAAIVAAIAIWLTGWMPIDPILSSLVSLLILRSAWSLLRNSLQILMEGAPGNVVVEEIGPFLTKTVPGLGAVRHIHVWSITSNKPLATLEIALAPGADPAAVTRATKAALLEAYGIAHSTVEIDWSQSPTHCALGDAAAPA